MHKETETEVIATRVPARLKAELKRIADRDERSVGWLTRKAIQALLAKEQAQHVG